MERELLIQIRSARTRRRVERAVMALLLVCAALSYTASTKVRTLVHSPYHMVLALMTGFEMIELEGVAQAYKDHNGDYPKTARYHELIRELYPSGHPRDPHDRLKDLWGRPYQYIRGYPHGFQLASMGRDGVLGTGDDILIRKEE
jgi:hypothetical protein